jgi:hypothetical protein
MNIPKLKNFRIKVQGKKYYVVETFNGLGSLNSLYFKIYRKNEEFTSATGIKINRKKIVRDAIEKELAVIESARKTAIDIEKVQPIMEEINSKFSTRGSLVVDSKPSRNEENFYYEDINISRTKTGKKTLLTITVVVYDVKKKGQK